MQCKLSYCCRQITVVHTVTESTISTAHTALRKPVHRHHLQNIYLKCVGSTDLYSLFLSVMYKLNSLFTLWILYIHGIFENATSS